MHATDDVHARGAAMVARVLSGVEHPDYLAWQAGRNAAYRTMLDRLAARVPPPLPEQPLTVAGQLAQADAALARAFDEA